MKIQEIPTDRDCLIICKKTERGRVEAVLLANGYEPTQIDYRGEEESAISIWVNLNKYTDVMDYKEKVYSKLTKLKAHDFLTANE